MNDLRRKAYEIEFTTRFANNPRLYSIADELRRIDIYVASADTNSYSGCGPFDGCSNGRGCWHRNGGPHSSNADANFESFSNPDSCKHAHYYSDFYFFTVY